MTGMFLLARSSSVLATAAVSCGAMTIALAPCASRLCTLAASLVMSFWELVRGNALMFIEVMSDSMYFAYEFQKSESERGWSIPTLPVAAPPLDPLEPLLPPRLHPVAVRATSAMPATTTAVLRLSMSEPHSCVGGVHELLPHCTLFTVLRVAATAVHACRRPQLARFRWWRWPTGLPGRRSRARSPPGSPAGHWAGAL